MKNLKKRTLITALGLMAVGAIALWGTQRIMHATSSPEFCVSCHSMSHPELEWQGSSHFANAKGIRAECADCHVPQEGWHYVKAKFIALKDVWYTATGKLDSKEKYETHRAEMAQRVWDDMKATDSETCRSCHSFDAMELSAQSKLAKQTHIDAKTNGQTCIDCHKGIVHFLPEVAHNHNADSNSSLGGVIHSDNPALYVAAMANAQAIGGGEIRLMPFAELSRWQEKEGQIQATLHGWQQVGAEAVIYQELGKRITLAVTDDEARAKAKILQTQHDAVTDSEWREVEFTLNVAKEKLSSNLTALNDYGNQLNQANCSSCHAPIGAEHYTANQWIGVINSMKDRTSMTADEVRAVTIYLQRNAKDMAHK